MRNDFHDTLDTLVSDLARMCDRASAMMQSATTALLAADAAEAQRLRADLTELTSLAVSVNDRAYRLLALQAPVARDLRTVVAALHIGADADRMGSVGHPRGPQRGAKPPAARAARRGRRPVHRDGDDSGADGERGC